jgi:hypothetical protein
MSGKLVQDAARAVAACPCYTVDAPGVLSRGSWDTLSEENVQS